VDYRAEHQGNWKQRRPVIVTTRVAASRPTILLAAIAAIALSMLYLISPVSAANFTPGQDGHPTTGESSDLKGGTATFTFQTNAILSCNGDTATSFSFHIDYTVTSGTLPAGATLVVYLSPNQGAINNNANGDAQGYIDDVQSNFFSQPIGGLTGSGTLDVIVTVGTSFELSGGGVLGVIANTASDQIVSTSKSNSVQCSEAQSVAESVAESIPASVAESIPASVAESIPASVGESVAESASGEQSVEAGTGTPAESQPNSSLFFNGSGPLATIAFSLILLASLGTLAYANVKSVRSRNQ
jgi:hypothetical protein